MRRRAILILTAVIVAAAFMPATAFAKTKTSTVYSQVVKKGKYVYCASYAGLYRVNVKTNKVKKLSSDDAGRMKLSGKYIYYISYTSGTLTNLCRVKKTGGGHRQLAVNVDKYKIEKKKIYCNDHHYYEGKETWRVMKLNGKNKKKSKVKVRMNVKMTNAGKYSVVNKFMDDYDADYNVLCYLKKPNGKTVYLGKTYMP
ncbi:MAG: DUF5050 domain-containing protein [Firmicutes bacterium]|nr:DUF5050 domain-containing protein [Bacillota bacterium]